MFYKFTGLRLMDEQVCPLKQKTSRLLKLLKAYFQPELTVICFESRKIRFLINRSLCLNKNHSMLLIPKGLPEACPLFFFLQ